MISAYLVYALLIIILTRRYLWKVVRQAIGLLPDPGDEPMKYRTAFLLFVGVLVATVAWGLWTGLNLAAVIGVFVMMTLFCFVAMKIRAECGTPMGRIGPLFGFTFFSFLGGMSFIGADGLIFAIMFFLLVANGGFYLIPGLQMEMLQLGRRSKLPVRHLAYALILGVFGGMIIGGWGHLTVTYGLGLDGVGNNLPFTGHFTGTAYTEQLSVENKKMEEAREEQTGAGGAADAEEDKGLEISPRTWAYIYGAGVTGIVTVLRQFFAGFSFHPIGIILGPTPMLSYCWGSILFAWFLRFMTLKLGGAVSVRSKLAPFAVGVFLAGVTAHLLHFLVNAWLLFFQTGGVREPVFF